MAIKLQNFGTKHLQDSEINAIGIPHAIEVTRFVLASHETSIEPNLSTATLSQNREPVDQTIQQLAPPLVPGKHPDYFIPGRPMLTLG